MSTNINPTEALALLQGKLGDLEARQRILVAEREELSYGALVDGDAKAKKRLDQIGHDLALIDHEAQSIKAAAVEAGRRAEAAEDAARQGYERDRARKALELVGNVHALATGMDKAATKLFADFGELRAIFIELNRLGVARPQIMAVDVSCKRALAAASTGTRLEIERLAPSERKTFAESARPWVEGITAWANARLGETEEKAA